jgi:hypothetical protein
MQSITRNEDSAFWQQADDCLIRYSGGAPFIRRIIERADGVYLYDADGKRIIDFTSGQVSTATLDCYFLFIDTPDELDSWTLKPGDCRNYPQTNCQPRPSFFRDAQSSRRGPRLYAE